LTVIKSLKLKNFKSFRKAEIPFAEGFTAIAGANASGKSNILDALLFAMGITSLKQLRASRLTELVNHDASEGYAKVELEIRDNNGKEFVVTRIVDKHGKSVYKLDDKKKTLNEIQSLLLEIGINPSGHNIVVQGDITRIIEMNAKQRRQVIEEVAGLQEFEEKKEEAIKKLEKVEQKVKDANLILNEREAYLAQLEKERANALKHNELREELKRAKATILNEEIKIIRKELDAAKKSLERMQTEIEEKRKERDKLQEEERELENKVEAATKKLISASEETYSGFGKEVEQLKAQIGIVNERMNSKNEGLEAKTKRTAELSEALKDAKEKKNEKSAQLKSAKDSLDKIDEQLEDLKKIVRTKTPKFEEKKGGIESKEMSYLELGKEIENYKEKLHEVKLRKNGLEKDVKSAEHSLKDLEENRKRLEEKHAKMRELTQKFKLLEAKDPKAKLEAKENELEKIGSELHSTRGRIESLEESLGKLEGVKGDCPICETPLEKARQEKVVEKRKLEIQKLKTKLKGFSEQRETIHEEKKKLHAEEKELSELKYHLKNFDGIDVELTRVREKISANKDIINLKQFHRFEEEEKALVERISKLENERNAAELVIQEFKKSEANSEMTQLFHRMEELNEQKNEKQQLVTELKGDVERNLAEKIQSIEKESKTLETEMALLKKQVEELEEEKTKSEKKLAEAESALEKSNKANKLLEEEKNRITTKIKNISEKRDTLGRKIENQEREMNELNLQQSKNDVRIVDLEEESKEYQNVKAFHEFVLNDLRKRIPEIEKEIDKMGAINMKSLEDFEHFKKEVDDVREKANKLDEERKIVLEMIDKIEVRKLNVFMDCYNHINREFSQIYYNFFEGEGRLDLNDKEDPLAGGLLLQAKYKEGVMKSIDAMSGGEKSLTALAFLFAIQSFEPAPFYIFDEVDAALDKENSIKIGRMIKGQAGKSQFISISHNDSVINQADQIIGVALNKQKSSVIGLRLPKKAHAEAVPAGE